MLKVQNLKKTMQNANAKSLQDIITRYIVTRAGRLQEYALVSDQMVKQWKMVAFGSFRNSLTIHKDKTEEMAV